MENTELSWSLPAWQLPSEMADSPGQHKFFLGVSGAMRFWFSGALRLWWGWPLCEAIPLLLPQWAEWGHSSRDWGYLGRTGLNQGIQVTSSQSTFSWSLQCLSSMACLSLCLLSYQCQLHDPEVVLIQLRMHLERIWVLTSVAWSPL